MACSILKTIHLGGRQEFRICTDEAGTLRLEIAGTGRPCSASAALAEARPINGSGKYEVIEHDIYIGSIDELVSDYLRGECADRDAAVQMSADILH